VKARAALLGHMLDLHRFGREHLGMDDDRVAPSASARPNWWRAMLWPAMGRKPGFPAD
jgi:hypothetical protein